MTQADRFLALYNRLDAHLRDLTDMHEPSTSFGAVLSQAARQHAAVAAHVNGVRRFINLRNAIVHGTRYGTRVIAEPHDRAVDEFERHVAGIMRPPSLDAVGSVVSVVFQPGQQLAAPLHYMREYDYSQVVVRGDKGVVLLTTEGIARWIEHALEDTAINPRNAELRAVLPHEPPGLFKLMLPTDTIHDARSEFQSALIRTGTRLFAVLVDLDAKRPGVHLKIITPWDIMGAGS